MNSGVIQHFLIGVERDGSAAAPSPPAAAVAIGGDQPVRHPAAAAMTLAGMTLAGPVAGLGPVAAGRGADLAVTNYPPCCLTLGK